MGFSDSFGNSLNSAWAFQKLWKQSELCMGFLDSSGNIQAFQIGLLATVAEAFR
jgi:hypothetical protein